MYFSGTAYFRNTNIQHKHKQKAKGTEFTGVSTVVRELSKPKNHEYAVFILPIYHMLLNQSSFISPAHQHFK